jgi:hypothetical protein
VETWIVLWRCLNIVLATAGLVLLVDDIRRRSKLKLRQRFYWQAVALLLVSAAWGSIAAIVEERELDSPRAALTTVALSYFLISIVQVRRFNRREERESGVAYGAHS